MTLFNEELKRKIKRLSIIYLGLISIVAIISTVITTFTMSEISRYHTYSPDYTEVYTSEETERNIINDATIIPLPPKLSEAAKKIEEINKIVTQLKKDYPDLTIDTSEEITIMRNIPSNVTYRGVKDEMLKQGFKFE